MTFIAAHHYIRIFNFWVDAYSHEGVPQGEFPQLTSVSFKDVYLYVDWWLTVPLRLVDMPHVIKLEAADFNSRAWTLGLSAARMVLSGYYEELAVEDILSQPLPNVKSSEM